MASTNILEPLHMKPEAYGPDFREHLMDQYKLYIEMADRVSQRRATANNFFLSANTLIVSIFGAVVDNSALTSDSTQMWFPLLIALSGLAFSIAWFYIVKSYRQLNSGKFKVIQSIEQNLPLALYKVEWEALGKGKDPKIYWPLSKIETYVPLTFSMIYLAITLFNIYLLYN
jgi:hypothetical protein